MSLICQMFTQETTKRDHFLPHFSPLYRTLAHTKKQ
uniref:Uncharacterized protein n=1 Tax=Rhizophora mucronata TaxID=61149 RepID=A0A2P2PLF1_RHIMU